MTTRIAPALLLAAALLASGAPARAQSTPTPSPSPSPSPSGITLPNMQVLDEILNQAIQTFQQNIQQGILNRQNDITGTVTYYRRFDLQVQTGSSTYRTVHLHQGTIINPTGTTLQNGMKVRVRGQSQSDGSLNADEIDVV
ncbi:MAG TPA: hypothetical protein VNJ51_11975 [Candidatus Dormibacteraeota bacterium]|nr:hypothetical protein [Candidatus Dormibacteraeota bacterium]